MSTKNVFVRVNGVDVGFTGFINLIQGTNVTFDVVEDFSTDYTTVTINSTGGSLSGAVSHTSDITVTDVGTQNDYDPAGLSGASVIRWDGASNATWNGLAGGTDGRIITVRNVSSAAAVLSFQHQNVNSAAANRFSFLNGVTPSLRQHASMTFQYDETSGYWYSIGHIAGPASAGAAITLDAAGATGTAGQRPAPQDHGHRLDTYSLSPAALGVASPGTSGTAPSRGDHVHLDPVTAHVAAGDPHTVYAQKAAANVFTGVEQQFTGDPVGGNVVEVRPSGNASTSSSVGGALLLENTSSSGAGMVIYSNHATSTARLLSIWADNAGYGGNPLYVRNDGTNHAVVIDQQGTGASSTALTITSTNADNSTVGISGQETGRGTVKITHTGTGTDGNAAALSILLAGTGTAAQGIFVDTDTGVTTTGTLLNLKNNASAMMTLTAAGMLTLPVAGATGGIQFAGEAASNLYRSAASTVKTDGSFIVGATLRVAADIVNNSSANNSRIRLQSTGATVDRNLADANTVLLVQNLNASGTGSLTDWKNSTTVVSKVDSGGAHHILADLANPLVIAKSTVAAAAPGAGKGALRWEAGTNAGTLKLVAYAGTSTTGVTIIDNVGTGS